MEEMPVEGLMQAEAGVYGIIAATPDPAEGSWYLYAAVIPGLTEKQTEALRRWAVDQFVDLGTTADPLGCGWTLHPTGAWHKWAHIAQSPLVTSAGAGFHVPVGLSGAGRGGFAVGQLGSRRAWSRIRPVANRCRGGAWPDRCNQTRRLRRAMVPATENSCNRIRFGFQRRAPVPVRANICSHAVGSVASLLTMWIRSWTRGGGCCWTQRAIPSASPH